MALGVLYPILVQTLPAISISSAKSLDETVVPKSSIQNNLNYLSQKAIPTLPKRLPLLPSRVMLPLVRQRGVLKSINDLGKIFNLGHYEYNHITFWYLDILTDFLWRLQDDYQLPLEFQRIGLSWIIFFLSTLKDVDINYNREEIFTILHEIVMLAGETMDEGDPYLPRPEKLAKILTIDDCHRINKLDEASIDSENEEIDYIDLRNGNERSLFIIKPSLYNMESSGSEISVSTSNTLSPISSKVATGDGSEDNEEEQDIDTDEIELQQHADMEKLSVKTMLAVIDYIFEYFYNDFQYSIIRSAVINPPNYIEEKIEEFHFPKKMAEDPIVDKTPKAKSEKGTKDKATSKMSTKKGSVHSLTPTPEPSFSNLLDAALQIIRAYKKTISPLKNAVFRMDQPHPSMINL